MNKCRVLLNGMVTTETDDPQVAYVAFNQQIKQTENMIDVNAQTRNTVEFQAEGKYVRMSLEIGNIQ